MAEYTELEMAAGEYSDWYKDAYGSRPRFDTSNWTIADYDAEIKRCIKICEQNRKFEEEADLQAIAHFEARIEKLIGFGAADRDTAIEWLHDAENTNGCDSYLCYCMNLPYGYLQAA